MKHHLNFTLLATVAACGVAADEPAPPDRADRAQALLCGGGYTVTNLSAVPGPIVQYTAAAVSPDGAVAGTARPADGYSPFQVSSWTPTGGLVGLGSLGGNEAHGVAINAAHQIAGSSYLANNVDQHAFFYDPATGFHDIGTLGGEGFAGSEARGINAAGTVVGYAALASEHHRAFTWTNGVLTNLGTHPTGYNSEAYAINDAGVVVGRADENQLSTAAMWRNGQITNLGSLGGTSIAHAINSAGIAVGQASIGGLRYMPVIFTGGSVIQLEIPEGYDRGVARGINDSGQIVGDLRPIGGGSRHAFVWQADQMYLLNDLVDDSSLTIVDATGINARGQIVAQAADSAGLITAVLLTPNKCDGPKGFVEVTTSEGPHTIDVPADTTPGDLLVLALELDSPETVIRTPIGWNLVVDKRAGVNTANPYHAMVFTHVATATEPTTYTLDVPEGVWVGSQIAAYRGVSSVKSAASTARVGTSIGAPSLAGTKGDILVTVFIDWVGGSWSTPSGLTERTDFSGNSLKDRVLTKTGATGTKTASNGESGGLAAISLLLH